MGIFNGLIGNASEVKIENLNKEYERILTKDEK